MSFEWTLEGMPVPRDSKALAKEQLQQLHHAALGVKYEGDWDPDLQCNVCPPEYEGMTLGEVAILKTARRAAAGDHTAYKEMMDRTLGKPKQAIESTSMHMSYTELLEALAKEDEAKTINIEYERLDDYEELLRGL